MNMSPLLVILLAVIVSLIFTNYAFAESTHFDSVKFIQYLDENTALEEVRKGNLDMYYYRISSDRLEDAESRRGLQIYDSTGGSYSILINPAESEKFNPFSIRDIRFALNYLVDRKLVVNELMGGYGAPMISYYSPYDPEFLTILEQLELFNFRYNPSVAREMIEKSLLAEGAEKINGLWMNNNTPIEIVIFIRSDDPVRKSIGEILASELEKIGFIVKKDFGDLNKAFVVVYGSNPADLKWNLYTEGWSRSAFVRYDSVGLGQMYAPWFSNMPGFNDPSYWNYENEKLDLLTQKIYTSDFKSEQERAGLIQASVIEGIKESVRVFVASKIDQYVVNEKIEGVVNDFGAGVPSRFTPINARADSDELVIGVKQIYQGAWNPVMGLSDSYSRHVWGVISDPVVFKHPFSGETFPLRAEWEVETAGPNNKLDLPDDAMIWNPYEQKWAIVNPEAKSTSKIVFDFKFGNWHHGQRMDMNDVLHALYFTIEWGTKTSELDKTIDTEFTPRAAQIVDTIIGVKPIDEDTLEVYVDYWHFNKGEIAEWGAVWSTMPWELFSAMEQAVKDGKVSFSRSGATSKSVSWLSLIVPNDSKIIQEYLEKFEKVKHIPIDLESFNQNQGYFEKRYQASIEWIKNNNHAVISNGPFILKSYSSESRTIMVESFRDSSYPFTVGKWSKFEEAKFPKIVEISIPEIMTKRDRFDITINTEETSVIKYFIVDGSNKQIVSGSMYPEKGNAVLKLGPEITQKFVKGAGEFRVFAISDTVLKPDYYSRGFFVADDKLEKLSVAKISNVEETVETTQLGYLMIIPALVGFLILLLRKRKHQLTKP